MQIERCNKFEGITFKVTHYLLLAIVDQCNVVLIASEIGTNYSVKLVTINKYMHYNFTSYL